MLSLWCIFDYKPSWRYKKKLSCRGSEFQITSEILHHYFITNYVKKVPAFVLQLFSCAIKWHSQKKIIEIVFTNSMLKKKDTKKRAPPVIPRHFVRNWLILTNVQKFWKIYVWIIKMSSFFVLIIRKLNVDSIRVKSYIRTMLGPLRLANRPEISASKIVLFFLDGDFWNFC